MKFKGGDTDVNRQKRPPSEISQFSLIDIPVSVRHILYDPIKQRGTVRFRIRWNFCIPIIVEICIVVNDVHRMCVPRLYREDTVMPVRYT